MDDLTQLGAYVVIILVIGGASVIKKIIEARKRQEEIEKHRGKTMRLDEEQSYHAEEETISRVEESEREIVMESESEGPAEKPKIEDILKDIFNIPTVPQKRATVIKSIPRKEEQQPQPVVSPLMVDAPIGEILSASSKAGTHPTKPSWETFATGLKRRGLNEIQQAIVMSEIIQKPKSKRGSF